MPDKAKAMKVRCPKCNAQPNFSCRKTRSLKDVRLVFLKHPHQARVAAAENQES